MSAGRRQLFVWWAASRSLVLVCALVVQVARFPRATWHPSLLNHPFALLGVWDGLWYKRIATGGYLFVSGRYSNPAFFPLLPVIERLAHLLGLPLLLTAIVLANVGFLVGLILVYELGREYLPESDARRAALYLAVFPAGYVFSMAYPEGVALPLLAAAALCAVRDRWLTSGLCAAAAALARPESIFLVLPLAAIAARHWAALPLTARSRAVGAVLAGPAALASFSAFLWWQLGDPLAWSRAERAWGRSFSATGIYRAGLQLWSAPRDHNLWLYRDAACCGIYLLLLVLAYRARIPRTWVLAGLAIVLMPLASGSFDSDARFGLLALPVFWGLAVLGRSAPFDRIVLIASPVLLALATLTIQLRYP